MPSTQELLEQIRLLKAEVAVLREENKQLEDENGLLGKEIERLEEKNDALEKDKNASEMATIRNRWAYLNSTVNGAQKLS